MRILISFCNAKVLGLPLLGMLDPATRQVDVLQLPECLPPIWGFTGMATSEKYLFVATQAVEMPASSGGGKRCSLLILDRATFRLVDHAILSTAADVHSL